MQFSTLVILTFAALVLGTDNPTVTKCQTVTSTIDPYGQFATCIVPACLEVKPVTQRCGCPPVETTNVQATACPTGRCGSTSYITAIEDCFPTPPPSSTVKTTSHPVTTTPSASSSTTSSPPPPHSTHSTTATHSSSTTNPHPPHSSTTSSKHEPHPTTTPPSQNPYTNTTKTVTTTEHSTTVLTTCPAKHACTGETVTVTSTEFCPTSTCVCILPSVVFTTTVLPGQTQSRETQSTITPPPNTQPGNTPPSPRPTTSSLLESNVASKFGVEAGLGLVVVFFFAVAGLL